MSPRECETDRVRQTDRDRGEGRRERERERKRGGQTNTDTDGQTGKQAGRQSLLQCTQQNTNLDE